MVILFDLGGVFVPDSTEALNREMADHVGMTEDELAGKWRATLNGLFTGKTSVQDFYSNTLAGCGDPNLLVRKHIGIYLRLYRLDQDMLELLSQIKTRYVTACLTNTELEIAEVNREKGLYGYFDHAFLSTEMGLRKPDKDVFLEVIRRLAVSPSDVVFVDDKSENIAAAGAAGMKTVLFTNPLALKEELRRLDGS